MREDLQLDLPISELQEENEYGSDEECLEKDHPNAANEHGSIYVCGKWRSLNETSEINFHEEDKQAVNYGNFTYSVYLASLQHTVNTYLKKPVSKPFSEKQKK
jgi:hypothetical protein